MYKLHLILKYLRKRRIAWVSLIAVTLCTAMVLVVISVMGGWLRMFRQSFHGLSGDVIVHGDSLTGFPFYEEMIDKIQALPEIRAAVPTIETFGLLNLKNMSRLGVRVIGYPIERIGEVNEFPKSLYRQYVQYDDIAKDATKTPAERAEATRLRDENLRHPSFDKPLPPEDYRAQFARGAPEKWPGMIVGVGVLGMHKNADGKWPNRSEFEYTVWAKLTVMGMSGESASMDIASDKSERNYWIVDDSRTQVWQYDQSSVYVPFDILQADLSMNRREERNPDTGATRTIPARTRDIQVSVKSGADLQVAKQKIKAIVDQVAVAHNLPAYFPIQVETWEESQATFIAAIEKEKALVTFLFGMISIVAIFLIFCIFYMIVVEKTKDIGIIKSVGATNGGVAGIFLGYGLAIGMVGAGLGLLFGYLIVHNINYLHEQMGRLLHIQIWNPEVYAFDTIPNTMNPREVAVILAVALVSAVLGALVPAWRASRMNPVEALRFE